MRCENGTRRSCAALGLSEAPDLAPKHFVDLLLCSARDHHQAVCQSSAMCRVHLVGQLLSIDSVANQRPVQSRCRDVALLVMRLIDGAVVVHFEALTIESNDLFRLLVFQTAYDGRNVDGLAGKVLQHGPATKQEFFERRFRQRQCVVATYQKDSIADTFFHSSLCATGAAMTEREIDSGTSGAAIVSKDQTLESQGG